MGFFSYTCSKTHLPILADDPRGRSKVVVLDKDGSKFRGTYDGYGRVYGAMGEMELDYGNVLNGDVKLLSGRELGRPWQEP
jgi:hypothetical protein